MEVIVFLGIAIIEGILSLLAKTKIKAICNCAIATCSIIAAFYFCYHLHQVGLCLNGANWFWILVQKSWTKEKNNKSYKRLCSIIFNDNSISSDAVLYIR